MERSPCRCEPTSELVSDAGKNVDEAILRSSVRILPGLPRTRSQTSSFPSSFVSDDGTTIPSEVPPPPSSPPPNPYLLCKIAVIGGVESGKSSIVRKFINRRPVETDRGLTKASVEEVSSSDSPATAEYFKKDVTISAHSIFNNTRGGELFDRKQKHNAPKALCVRVQVWDINLKIGDVSLPPKSSTSLEDLSAASANRSILSLLHSSDGIVIACRCPLPPSRPRDFPSSKPCGTQFCRRRFFRSRLSRSGWPELDSLEETILHWIRFLRAQTSATSISTEENSLNEGHCNSVLTTPSELCQGDTSFEMRQKRGKLPVISLLLNHSDQAAMNSCDYSPHEWIQLYNCMEEICYRYHIESWTIGTCVDTGTFVTGRNHHLRQSLEDMEDAIELTFMDIIISCVKRSREVNNQKLMKSSY